MDKKKNGNTSANPEGQVSLSRAGGSHAKKKKPLTKKQLLIRIGIIAGSVLLALIIVFVSVFFGFMNKLDRTSDLSGDLSINPGLSTGVLNIALFGLDTEQDAESGRSDSMIILSVDRDHDKIKLTSLGRDSLVSIDGHGKSKLTHAFAWGGVDLAVKTINANFGMNITDYVYVNFFEFTEIIDYIGGVDIDVSAGELDVANNYYLPILRRIGIPCDPIPRTGYQHVTGAQALCYARNRYTGSDIDRTDRQKEVLQSAYDNVKQMSFVKYPALISKILSICHTDLDNGTILSLASWALTKNPTFETLNIPGTSCGAIGGVYENYGWVYRYSMDTAKAVLHNFIYETNLDTRVVSVPTSSNNTPGGTTAIETTTTGYVDNDTGEVTTTTKTTKSTKDSSKDESDDSSDTSKDKDTSDTSKDKDTSDTSGESKDPKETESSTSEPDESTTTSTEED